MKGENESATKSYACKDEDGCNHQQKDQQAPPPTKVAVVVFMTHVTPSL